ncbi:MAG: hypothetical protein R6U61_07505 [Thermoplasmata archaeon]
MSRKEVRGTIINGYLEFVKTKWGENGLRECKEFCGITKEVNDGQFYVDEVKIDILRWIGNKHGEEYVVDAGKFLVSHLGLLSWIVRFMDPYKVAVRFPKEYNQVYNFGRVEVKGKPGNILIKLYDVCSSKEVCLSWKGICLGLLDITGVEGDVVKSSCQLEGEKSCDYLVKYTVNKNKEYEFKSYRP